MKMCLIGSTKFMDQFSAANQAFTLVGHTVYSVVQSHDGKFTPDEEGKMLFDLVHLNKILESDAVVVVGQNPDGSMYLGESTRREIMWAHLQEKQVVFWDSKLDWKSIKGPRDDFSKTVEMAKETTLESEARREEHHRKMHASFESMGLMPTGSADRCPASDKPKVN